MNVAVIGASPKPDRYSYQALMLLHQQGYKVFPVHPRVKEIEGIPVYASLPEIPDEIHTVTLYVSAAVSQKLTSAILAKHPQRIIFNPGAENPDLARAAMDSGIEALEACTLVLVRTGQFGSPA